MPSGMHAASLPLRWSLKSRTSAAVVATGLLLLLLRHIWRGGGRKLRDPGGTKSCRRVKEKKVGVLECVEEEDALVLPDEKVSVSQDQEPVSDLKTGEEELSEEVVSVKEDLTESIGEVEELKELGGVEEKLSVEENSSALVEKEEVQNKSLEKIVESAVKALSDNVDCLKITEEVVKKESDLVTEAVSIIPEVCQSVTEKVVVSSAVTGAGEGPEEGVKEVFKENKEEDKLCLKDVPTEETGEKQSLVEEEVKPVNSVSLTCGVVVEEKDLQDLTNGETSEPVRSKRSIGVQEEVKQEEVKQEEVLKQPEESVVQMNASVMGGGKRKSAKKNKEVQKVGLGKKEIDMKDLERVIMQNDAEVEEHQSKCDVTGNHPLESSGIGSPSMSNFPDNRSEGSSCGDSGKGRSDVTTPGGLEEEEREVSFPHHFSPPCSTSGPEEEEEDSANGAAGDGSLEGGNPGEAVMLSTQAGLLLDGSMVPMGVPYAVYPIAPLVPPPSVYEFVIPQGLVGRLIGKHGSFVNLIKARTSANIFIKTHPESSKLKVCAIEGTDSEIQAALEMIREKFPPRRFSSMTLEQVFFLRLPLPAFPVIPDSLQLLQLVEGVSNDVILSAMVSPSHFFLQQPTHPTYPTLAKLDMWMSVCYQDADAPPLPENVEAGSICAAPTMGGWYRAQIVAIEEVPSEVEGAEEGELVKMCDIRFVDYGGYERLPAESLRQIKTDFMTLPFQACECYLASVVPAPTSDENKTPDGWSMQAYSLVENLTQAQVIQAQVVGHAPDGLPLVFLYTFSHSYGQVIHVNQELVRQGLAVWVVPEVVGEQTEESASEEYEQTADEAEAKAA